MKKDLGSKDMVFPTPVFIVGTYNAEGVPNAMNVAWGGICGSNPPSVAIAIRKSRCTYDNINEKMAFTVNIPSEKHVAESDYFGMASGKNGNKLEQAGLTTIKSKILDAPIIQEFPFALECKVINQIENGQHIIVIGEILNVTVDEDCLGMDGEPDIEKIAPMLYNPAKVNYYGIGSKIEEAFSVGKKFMKKE